MAKDLGRHPQISYCTTCLLVWWVLSVKICNVSRIYTIDERSYLKFRMFTWLNFQVWTQNCSTASVRLVACQSSAVPRLSTKIKTAPVPNHMCTKKCSSQQYPQPKKTNANFCFANQKGWWLMICIKNLSPCKKYVSVEKKIVTKHNKIFLWVKVKWSKAECSNQVWCTVISGIVSLSLSHFQE